MTNMSPKLILNHNIRVTSKEDRIRAKVEELLKKADELKTEIEDLQSLLNED